MDPHRAKARAASRMETFGSGGGAEPSPDADVSLLDQCELDLLGQLYQFIKKLVFCFQNQ
jgi:hypothetical protein